MSYWSTRTSLHFVVTSKGHDTKVIMDGTKSLSFCACPCGHTGDVTDFIRSGFATFDRLDRIRDLLTRILHTPVDVIAEPKHSNRAKAAIDKDRRLAF